MGKTESSISLSAHVSESPSKKKKTLQLEEREIPDWTLFVYKVSLVWRYLNLYKQWFCFKKNPFFQYLVLENTFLKLPYTLVWGTSLLAPPIPKKDGKFFPLILNGNFTEGHGPDCSGGSLLSLLNAAEVSCHSQWKKKWGTIFFSVRQT